MDVALDAVDITDEGLDRVLTGGSGSDAPFAYTNLLRSLSCCWNGAPREGEGEAGPGLSFGGIVPPFA